MKIKILHIITAKDWGGAPKIFFDLITNLNKDLFEVDIISAPGILANKLKTNGFRVFAIDNVKRNISPFNDLMALIKIYRIIKNNKYDIVHCHTSKAGLLGRVAARMAGVKKIYFTVHGWSFYNKKEYGFLEPLFIWIERFCARFSTKLICVSESVKKDGIVNKVAPQDKFIVIYNGIEQLSAIRDKDLIKKDFNLKNCRIITMASRLAYPKMPLQFIKLGEEIIKKNDSVKFILVGGGPLLSECQDYVKEHNLNDKILLLGEKDNKTVDEILSITDIFVLLTEFEALGLVALEAMNKNLPVILSNVGGLKELINNNEGGFLIDNQNLQDLPNKIYDLLENKELCQQFGNRNTRIVSEKFTLEKMVEAYMRLYSTNDLLQN